MRTSLTGYASADTMQAFSLATEADVTPNLRIQFDSVLPSGVLKPTPAALNAASVETAQAATHVSLCGGDAKTAWNCRFTTWSLGFFAS